MKKTKNLRRIWLAAPLLLVAVGVVVGYAWWQSPASTSVDYGAQATGNVLASDTALTPWQTSYFSTRVSSGLRVKSSNDSVDYGSYLLTSSVQREDDQLGVTVAKLGSDSLNEVPAVRLRLASPAQYVPVKLAFAPAGAYAFTDETGYEMSVFWQQGEHYAAVVASGTSARRAELDQELQDVVSNWKWQ